MDQVQRMLLEGEGVEFDVRGRVDLDRDQWKPRVARKRTRKKKKERE